MVILELATQTLEITGNGVGIEYNRQQVDYVMGREFKKAGMAKDTYV